MLKLVGQLGERNMHMPDGLRQTRFRAPAVHDRHRMVVLDQQPYYMPPDEPRATQDDNVHNPSIAAASMRYARLSPGPSGWL